MSSVRVVVGFLASLILAAPIGARAESPTNLVFIVVDTLGSEHLSLDNESLNTSPNLLALAKNGARFKRAYSAAPWTKPSLASLFTGRMPSRHYVIGLNSILPDDQLTLAETFKVKGFQTAGIISHTLITAENGYSQGFDSYEIIDFKGNIHNDITSEKVTNMALGKLHNFAESKKPFMLFLHYFDPHYNYQHHEQFDRTSGYTGKLKPGMDIRKLRARIPKLTKEDINFLVGLYREEIAFTDFHIGRFLEEFRKLGFDKNTLVVVTADHGEEFMRHGHIGHTITLFDELIHVPLIMSWPGHIAPKVVESPVLEVDVAPTVWNLFGMDPKADVDGRSLTSLMSGKEDSTPRDLLSEVDFKSSHIQAYKVGVSRGSWKLVYDKPTSTFELYDRSKDPEELNDLAASNPPIKSELQKVLEGYMANIQKKNETKAPELERSPEEVEQLKSLGYM